MDIQKITAFTMDAGEHSGLVSRVPCSMYSVLLEHGLIDDPYYRDNGKRLRELSLGSCTFTAEFGVSDLTLSRKKQLLRFNCLDTLCEIELNGRKIADTDNMHRIYTLDVGGILSAGKNVLKIRIRSAADDKDGQSRKARYASGCEWLPALSDMGIMREVELISFDTGMIERVKVRQIHGEGEVRLDLTLHTSGSDELFRAVATLVSPAGNVFYSGLIAGKGTITVTNPNLWWPNGLGAQNLYKLTVNLYSDTEICDSREMKIGLRTLTLVEGAKESLNLAVNGVSFFSRGANYIPEDSIIPRLSRERTRRLLEDARAANFNTVRVLGGAYYPPDYFFESCDELGLVVWQDIEGVCDCISPTESLLENFGEELKDNLTRIAHHPSLGVVLGSGTAPLTGGEAPTDSTEQGDNILTALLKEYLPDTVYWEYPTEDDDSSPQKEEADNLPDGVFRLFGFPEHPCTLTLPSEKTAVAFAEEDDLNVFSPVLEWHRSRSSSDGGCNLTDYLSKAHRYPYSFGSLAYMTQLVLAESVRLTVERMRRERGGCMSSIYWQLNDCWPAISPSGIDYFGRWKALHYLAKRFYAPVLVSASVDGTRVTFNLSNEKRVAFDGSFSYSVVDNRQRTVFKDSFPISVLPMSAANILTTDLYSLISGHESEYVLVYSVSDGLAAKSQGTYKFAQPKSFDFIKPTFTSEISGSGTDFYLTLTSDVYAASVELDFSELDAVFDDNYFDLPGGVPCRVHFRTRDVTNLDALTRQLRIRSVYDIGREQ